MITLNKEILSHPDFTDNLADMLCEYLEELIDAEFEKGDETDFDFIDECANAINSIRSGNTAEILPVISRREFIKKVSGSSHKTVIKTAIAICAALAVIFSANTILSKTQNIDIIREVSGFFTEIFKGEAKPVETTQPQTTEAPAQAPVITGISVETDDNFKTEYYTGEKFSSDGLSVFAEYDNGEKKRLSKDEYTVTVSKDFGSEAKYETVTVEAAGLIEYVEIRVINSISTPKLTSIYAILPDDFKFTAKDLYNIEIDGMQVYAVYSDNSEKELGAGEYEINIETEKRLFEEYATVTIVYENCSCSFMVFKE